MIVFFVPNEKQGLIIDKETEEAYPVYSKSNSRGSVWHYTFCPTHFDKWWVIIGKKGYGVAHKYQNYHSVVGGSGHNSTAYAYRRAGLKW